MKATGIVRRIDDLGRVVVPKEIRRTLKIREGDPMEIYTDQNGEIILRKYSPVGEMSEFARQYVESLSKTTGQAVMICDKNTIVAASGSVKKDFLNKNISKLLSDIIEKRALHQAKRDEKKFIQITDEKDEFQNQIIAPIICEGDTMGAIIIANKDISQKLGDVETKLAVFAAAFMTKQLEV